MYCAGYTLSIAVIITLLQEYSTDFDSEKISMAQLSFQMSIGPCENEASGYVSHDDFLCKQANKLTWIRSETLGDFSSDTA